MDYKTLKNKIEEGEKNGHGEILYKTSSGIAYYDYDSCDFDKDRIFFRAPGYCTKEKLEKIIYCDRDVMERGVTPSVVADILFSAYGSEFADMMCVLRNIIIFHHHSGMEAGIREFDLLDEGDEFYFDPDNVGQMWFHRQTAFICEGTIVKECEGMRGPGEAFSTLYTDALGTTLVHETRHIMLDCNPFRPDDGEGDEESVEIFCRQKWDMVRHKFHIPGVTVRQLTDIVYDYLNVMVRFPGHSVIEEKVMRAFSEYRNAGGKRDMDYFKSTLDEYLVNGCCGY